MDNVIMIRPESGLVSIPVEMAVYCENCSTVSTCNGRRCGVCGSERIIKLAPLFRGPEEPSPVPAIALAA